MKMWWWGAKLNQILTNQEMILANQRKIMHTLDEVLATVTAEKGDIASLGAFITGLRQQVADALSGAAIPPAVQAKIDAVFDQATSNRADIAAAVAANPSPPSGGA